MSLKQAQANNTRIENALNAEFPGRVDVDGEGWTITIPHVVAKVRRCTPEKPKFHWLSIHTITEVKPRLNGFYDRERIKTLGDFIYEVKSCSENREKSLKRSAAAQALAAARKRFEDYSKTFRADLVKAVGLKVERSEVEVFVPYYEQEQEDCLDRARCKIVVVFNDPEAHITVEYSEWGNLSVRGGDSGSLVWSSMHSIYPDKVLKLVPVIVDGYIAKKKLDLAIQDILSEGN